MEKTCDLHVHSIYSDGTWTPTELIREARRIGLSALALTDHNTVAGVPEFLRAARGGQVEAIPGIEFSTDYRGMDLHIVALYVPEAAFPAVEALMEEGKREKERSNLRLIENLARAGYDLDYEAIRSQTPGGQVNRAHIAAAMVEKGWVSTIPQAFAEFLDPGCGYYIPSRRPDTFEILDFIRSIGAVSVLAHPFLKLDEAGVRTFLDRAVEHGLDAMETVYVSFDRQTTALAMDLAREYGLLMSGGSDFHADNKPGIFIGTGRGELAVPDAFYRAIRQRHFLHLEELKGQDPDRTECIRSSETKLHN